MNGICYAHLPAIPWLPALLGTETMAALFVTFTTTAAVAIKPQDGPPIFG